MLPSESFRGEEVITDPPASTPGGARAPGFFDTFGENLRASGQNPRKALTGFALALAAFLVILLVLPAPAGLSVAGKATLAVMSWACIIWIFEAMPVGVTGLLIPCLLAVTNAVKPFPRAADGFTNPVVFLCLAAFIFAALMQAAGLDKRIALAMLDKFKARSVNGVIWAMFVVNIVLSFIIPAANARAATLLPVVNGITKLFGETERERAAVKAIVIQTLVYGSMISGMCILTAHLPNLVITGLFQKELHVSLSYVDWFTLQWPYLLMFVITQWWVQRYFKTRGIEVTGGLETVREERAKAPPMGQSEWLILAVFGVIALAWMTESWHGVASHNVALLGLAVLFIPGMFGFKWKEIQDRTIWGTLLLLGGALSLSTAMSATGLANWLAEIVHRGAEGYPWWGVLLVMMIGTHIIRLGMLSNVAAVTMIAPPVLLLALAPRLRPAPGGLHHAGGRYAIPSPTSCRPRSPRR